MASTCVCARVFFVCKYFPNPEARHFGSQNVHFTNTEELDSYRALSVFPIIIKHVKCFGFAMKSEFFLGASLTRAHARTHTHKSSSSDCGLATAGLSVTIKLDKQLRQY